MADQSNPTTNARVVDPIKVDQVGTTSGKEARYGATDLPKPMFPGEVNIFEPTEFDMTSIKENWAKQAEIDNQKLYQEVNSRVPEYAMVTPLTQPTKRVPGMTGESFVPSMKGHLFEGLLKQTEEGMVPVDPDDTDVWQKVKLRFLTDLFNNPLWKSGPRGDIFKNNVFSNNLKDLEHAFKTQQNDVYDNWMDLPWYQRQWGTKLIENEAGEYETISRTKLAQQWHEGVRNPENTYLHSIWGERENDPGNSWFASLLSIPFNAWTLTGQGIQTGLGILEKAALTFEEWTKYPGGHNPQFDNIYKGIDTVTSLGNQFWKTMSIPWDKEGSKPIVKEGNAWYDIPEWDFSWNQAGTQVAQGISSVAAFMLVGRYMRIPMGGFGRTAALIGGESKVGSWAAKTAIDMIAGMPAGAMVVSPSIFDAGYEAGLDPHANLAFTVAGSTISGMLEGIMPQSLGRKFGGKAIANAMLREMKGEFSEQALGKAASSTFTKILKASKSHIKRMGYEGMEGAFLEGTTEGMQELAQQSLQLLTDKIYSEDTPFDQKMDMQSATDVFLNSFGGMLTGFFMSGGGAMLSKNRDARIADNVADGKKDRVIKALNEEFKKGNINEFQLDASLRRLDEYNKIYENNKLGELGKEEGRQIFTYLVIKDKIEKHIKKLKLDNDKKDSSMQIDTKPFEEQLKLIDQRISAIRKGSAVKKTEKDPPAEKTGLGKKLSNINPFKKKKDEKKSESKDNEKSSTSKPTTTPTKPKESSPDAVAEGVKNGMSLDEAMNATPVELNMKQYGISEGEVVDMFQTAHNNQSSMIGDERTITGLTKKEKADAVDKAIKKVKTLGESEFVTPEEVEEVLKKMDENYWSTPEEIIDIAYMLNHPRNAEMINNEEDRVKAQEKYAASRKDAFKDVIGPDGSVGKTAEFMKKNQVTGAKSEVRKVNGKYVKVIVEPGKAPIIQEFENGKAGKALDPTLLDEETQKSFGEISELDEAFAFYEVAVDMLENPNLMHENAKVPPISGKVSDLSVTEKTPSKKDVEEALENAESSKDPEFKIDEKQQQSLEKLGYLEEEIAEMDPRQADLIINFQIQSMDLDQSLEHPIHERREGGQSVFIINRIVFEVQDGLPVNPKTGRPFGKRTKMARTFVSMIEVAEKASNQDTDVRSEKEQAAIDFAEEMVAKGLWTKKEVDISKHAHRSGFDVARAPQIETIYVDENGNELGVAWAAAYQSPTGSKLFKEWQKKPKVDVSGITTKGVTQKPILPSLESNQDPIDVDPVHDEGDQDQASAETAIEETGPEEDDGEAATQEEAVKAYRDLMAKYDFDEDLGSASHNSRGEPMNPEIQEVLERELKKIFPNISIERVRALYDKFGIEILGLAIGASVYINQNKAIQSTIVHEFLHPYVALIRGTKLYEKLAEIYDKDPRVAKYTSSFGITKEQAIEECIIEDAEGMTTDRIVINATGTKLQRITQWLEVFWSRIKRALGLANQQDILRKLSSDFTSYRHDEATVSKTSDYWESGIAYAQHSPDAQDLAIQIKKLQNRWATDNLKVQKFLNDIRAIDSKLRTFANVEMDATFAVLKHHGIINVTPENQEAVIKNFQQIYQAVKDWENSKYFDEAVNLDEDVIESEIALEELYDEDSPQSSGDPERTMLKEMSPIVRSFLYDLNYLDDPTQRVPMVEIIRVAGNAARNARSFEEFMTALQAMDSREANAIHAALSKIKDDSEFPIMKPRTHKTENDALLEWAESEGGITYDEFQKQRKENFELRIATGEALKKALFFEFASHDLRRVVQAVILSKEEGGIIFPGKTNADKKYSQVVPLIVEEIISKLTTRDYSGFLRDLQTAQKYTWALSKKIEEAHKAGQPIDHLVAKLHGSLRYQRNFLINELGIVTQEELDKANQSILAWHGGGTRYAPIEFGLVSGVVNSLGWYQANAGQLRGNAMVAWKSAMEELFMGNEQGQRGERTSLDNLARARISLGENLIASYLDENGKRRSAIQKTSFLHTKLRYLKNAVLGKTLPKNHYARKNPLLSEANIKAMEVAEFSGIKKDKDGTIYRKMADSEFHWAHFILWNGDREMRSEGRYWQSIGIPSEKRQYPMFKVPRWGLTKGEAELAKLRKKNRGKGDAFKIPTKKEIEAELTRLAQIMEPARRNNALFSGKDMREVLRPYLYDFIINTHYLHQMFLNDVSVFGNAENMSKRMGGAVSNKKVMHHLGRKLRIVVLPDIEMDNDGLHHKVEETQDGWRISDETFDGLGVTETTDATSIMFERFSNEMAEATGALVNDHHILFKPGDFGPDDETGEHFYLKTLIPTYPDSLVLRTKQDEDNGVPFDEGELLETDYEHIRAIADNNPERFLYPKLAKAWAIANDPENPIDFMTFGSGVKTMNPENVSPAIDKDGNWTDSELTVIERNPEYFGIHNNPYHEPTGEGKITNPSQKMLQIGDGGSHNYMRLQLIEDLLTLEQRARLGHLLQNATAKEIYESVLERQENDRHRSMVVKAGSLSTPNNNLHAQRVITGKAEKIAVEYQVPGQELYNLSSFGFQVKDPETGNYRKLKWVRPEGDGEVTIQPAEVMVPESVAKVGETIMMTRIPSTGPNLTIPAVVVANVPDSMGNVTIIPDEATAILGLDNDGDKLFVQTRKGKKLDKTLFDLQWEIFTDPQNFKYMIQPTNPHLVKGALAKIVNKEGESLVPDPSQRNVHLPTTMAGQFQDIKYSQKAIGIFATFFKAYSALSQVGIRLSGQAQIDMDHGDHIATYDGFYSESMDEDDESRTPFRSLNIGTNIALDDGKLRYMSKMGMNEHNAPIFALMSALGMQMDEDAGLSALMLQPAIQDLFGDLEEGNSSIITDGSGIVRIIKDRMKTYWRSIPKEKAEAFKKAYPDFYAEMVKSAGRKTGLNPVPFKEAIKWDDLMEGLDPTSKHNQSPVWKLMVLGKYLQLHYAAQSMSDVVQIMSQNVRLPSDIYAIQQRQDLFHKVQNTEEWRAFFADTQPFFARQNVQHYSKVLSRMKEYFQEQGLLQAQRKWISMFVRIAETIKKTPRAEDYQRVSETALEYFLSRMFDGSVNTNEVFMYGSPDGKKIPFVRFIYNSKKRFPGNPFFENIEIVPGEETIVDGKKVKTPDRLSLKSSSIQMGETQLNAIRAGLMQFIQQETERFAKKDPPIHINYERSFLRYWFLSEGMVSSSFSISNAFSVEMHQQISDFIEANQNEWLDKMSVSSIAAIRDYVVKQNIDEYAPNEFAENSALAKSNPYQVGTDGTLKRIDSKTSNNVLPNYNPAIRDYQIFTKAQNENSKPIDGVIVAGIEIDGKEVLENIPVHRRNNEYYMTYNDMEVGLYYVGRNSDGKAIFRAIDADFQQKTSLHKRPGVRVLNEMLERLKRAFPNIEVQWDDTIEGFGMIRNGKVVLNPKKVRMDTPIHEFAHVWLMAIKGENPELYQTLLQKIKGTAYYAKAKAKYPEMNEEGILNEALADAIGDHGAKDVNKAQSIVSRAWKWIQKILKDLGLTKVSPMGLSDMTLSEIMDQIAHDFMAGEQLSAITSAEVMQRAHETLGGKESFQQKDEDFDIDAMLEKDEATAWELKRQNHLRGLYNKAFKDVKSDLKNWLTTTLSDNKSKIFTYENFEKVLAQDSSEAQAWLHMLAMKMEVLDSATEGQVDNEFDGERTLIRAIALELNEGNELTQEQLDQIKSSFKLLAHHESNFHQMVYHDGTRVNAPKVRAAVVEEIGQATEKREKEWRGRSQWTKNLYGLLRGNGLKAKAFLSQLVPTNIALLLTGSDKSILREYLYDAFDRGKHNALRFHERARKVMSRGQWNINDPFSTIRGVDVENWGGYNNSDHTKWDMVTIPLGSREVKITRAQALYIYMLLSHRKTDDTPDRIDPKTGFSTRSAAYGVLKNGVAWRDPVTGKNKRFSFGSDMDDAILRMNAFLQDFGGGALTDAEITSEQKNNRILFQSFRDYFTFAWGEINPVYNNLHGRSVTMEMDHVPVSYRRDETDVIKQGDKYKNRLEDVSFLMQRKGIMPDTPLELHDAFEIMHDQMNKAANYIGYALPLRNLRNIEGTDEFKQVVEKTGMPFINKIIQDYVGFHQNREKTNIQVKGHIERLSEAFYTAFIVAKLGLNYWTTIKGLGGIAVAGSEMEKEYLKKAMKDTYFLKHGGLHYLMPQVMFDNQLEINPEVREEMQAVEAYQLIERLYGASSKEMGEFMNSTTNYFTQKPSGFKIGVGNKKVRIPKKFLGINFTRENAMAGILNVDRAHTMTIFRAAKYKLIATKYPELADVNVKDWPAEAKIELRNMAEKVVKDTQPMFDVKDRSTLSMSSNTVWRWATIFQSQHNANYNAIMRRMINFSVNPSDNNRKRMNWALIGAQAVNGTIVAFGTIAKGALEGTLTDDDDEVIDDIARYGMQWATELLQVMYGMNYVQNNLMALLNPRPGQSTIEEPIVGQLNDLSKLNQELFRAGKYAIDGRGDRALYTSGKAFNTFFYFMSSIMGLPSYPYTLTQKTIRRFAPDLKPQRRGRKRRMKVEDML